MKAVKVSEFKAKLARYLRLVRNGGTVEILDRGVPIVRVTPLVAAKQCIGRAPIREPGGLASVDFDLRPKRLRLDPVALLLEDRQSR